MDREEREEGKESCYPAYEARLHVASVAIQL